MIEKLIQLEVMGASGFVNTVTLQMKVKLTPEEMLSGQWRHITRKERRALYRQASKDQMKRIAKDVAEETRRLKAEEEAIARAAVLVQAFDSLQDGSANGV